ncbi:MAG: M14 family zinc carboxypeptidase [Phycisphaerae bacterium]
MRERSGWMLAAVGGALLGAISPVSAQTADFDGHRVVRVDVRDEQQLAHLLTIASDVWSENTGVGPLDVRVAPEQFALLAATDLKFDIMVEDVGALIAAAEPSGIAGVSPFVDYLPYDQVLAYLDALVALRPDLASIVSVGPSLENRTITAIRITGPGGGAKPGVLYHGCQHAREWVTVPAILYIADRLIRDYDTDPYLRELVDEIEWILIPVVNPDGYVYSWTNNRLWRKNRRNNGNGTFGVDLNRNWGYQWGGEGASTNPNAEDYRGPSAFSEPETQALRDFILARPNLVAHTDVHSYSQLVLWPWSYTVALPPDQYEFNLVGTTKESLIEAVHGSNYVVGPTYTTIYPASGASIDWTYGVANTLAFAYELRPDSPTPGFLLPADQILPTCEEVFPALIYQADYASSKIRIDLPNGVPTSVLPGAAWTLHVRVTSAGRDPVDPASVIVHSRTAANGPFTETVATPLGNDLYEVMLPPRGCGTPTQIYISAAAVGGGTTFLNPPQAPAAVYTVPIGVLSVAFDDNFETDQGWTVQNTAVTAGAWVRVDPNGTTQGGGPAQPEDDNPDGTGTFCYVTGQGTPGGAVGAADLDGGPTRLLSPRLALGGQYPTVSYYRWFYNDDGDDSLIVEASDDDGASWTLVHTIDTSGRVWSRGSFELINYVEPTDNVRLRFSVSDNPNNSVTEAAVDDVQITVFACGGLLLGDLNCDNVVNNFDIDAFVLALVSPAAYAVQYPACDILAGDVNEDGVLDNFDIDAFVGLLTP